MFLVKTWKKLGFIFIQIRSCGPSLGRAGGRVHQCLLSAQPLQGNSFQTVLQGWCGHRLWGDYREQLEAEFSGETKGQPLLQAPLWRPLHCVLMTGGLRGLPSSLSCSSELEHSLHPASTLPSVTSRLKMHGGKMYLWWTRIDICHHSLTAPPKYDVYWHRVYIVL